VTTVNQLRTYLKKFTLYPALGEVGKLSVDLFREHESHRNVRIGQLGQQTVTQWGLAFIAWCLIESSNDGRRHSFQISNLLEASRIYAELEDPLPRDGNYFSWFNRTAQEQFWWQESLVQPFARQYLLLINPLRKPQSSVRSRIDEAFLNEFGLSMSDFLLITAYIAFYCSKLSVYFSLDTLLTRQKIPKLKEVITSEKLTKFLRKIAETYEGIRSFKQKADRLIIPGYQRHELNPLSKYPVVRADPRFPYKRTLGEFVVPNIMLLMGKMTYGLYWELRDLYKSKNSTQFLTDFGTIFEEYVRFLLEKFLGSSKVIKLQKEDANEKICDFAVVQDVVVLFECKASLIPFRARQTFIEEMLQPWLQEVVVYGAKQLFSTEHLLRNNKLRQVPCTPDARLFKVILTYETLYITEEPPWKDLIQRTFRSTGVFKEYPNINREIYLMDVQQLEQCEEVLKWSSFGDIFNEKTKLDKIQYGIKTHGFDQACKNILKKDRLSCPTLEELYKDFFGLS